MVKVIYFNQWFSSITDVIDDIRKKHGKEVKIIGSSKNPEHAYKDVVDVFLVEDWIETDDYNESMKNYIDWVITKCAEYKVDIFFAKKHANAIAENIVRFHDNRVFVIMEDYETLVKLDNKAGVYEELSKISKLHDYIPSFYCGNKLDDVQLIIDKASRKGNTPWCFKLNTDEGGFSFRSIEQKALDFDSLKHYRVNSISADEAKKLVLNIGKKRLNKLIFMELLDSPEISVDCYNSKRGFIAICREKESGTRVQRIYYSEAISNICKVIGEHYKFRFPFNVQFRIAHGEDKNDISNLRLLEINPRMSGGTYYGTLFGMNICEVCLLDMINSPEKYDYAKFIDFEDRKVTHVEKAVPIGK